MEVKVAVLGEVAQAAGPVVETDALHKHFLEVNASCLVISFVILMIQSKLLDHMLRSQIS